MKRRPLRVKRWEAKVRRYDEDDVRVDTWMTTVEAKTEPAAEQAALAAYGALLGYPEFPDGTSFYTRVDRWD